VGGLGQGHPEEMAENVEMAAERLAELTLIADRDSDHYSLICEKKHLTQWESRLAEFTPNNELERDLFDVASRLHAVYVEHPDLRLTALMAPDPDDEQPADEDEDEYYKGDYTSNYSHYLSLIWDYHSCTAEDMRSDRQCDADNCEVINENPRQLRYFDRPAKNPDDANKGLRQTALLVDALGDLGALLAVANPTMTDYLNKN